MTGGMIYAPLRTAPQRIAPPRNATIRLSRRICAGMAGKPSNASALLRAAPLRAATQRTFTQRKP